MKIKKCAKWRRTEKVLLSDCCDTIYQSLLYEYREKGENTFCQSIFPYNKVRYVIVSQDHCTITGKICQQDLQERGLQIWVCRGEAEDAKGRGDAGDAGDAKGHGGRAKGNF